MAVGPQGLECQFRLPTRSAPVSPTGGTHTIDAVKNFSWSTKNEGNYIRKGTKVPSCYVVVPCVRYWCGSKSWNESKPLCSQIFLSVSLSDFHNLILRYGFLLELDQKFCDLELRLGEMAVEAGGKVVTLDGWKYLILCLCEQTYVYLRGKSMLFVTEYL